MRKLTLQVSPYVVRSVSPELVVFLLGYSFLGTLAALRIFGKKMVHLQYEVSSTFFCCRPVSSFIM
jgi:hypothetical protein